MQIPHANNGWFTVLSGFWLSHRRMNLISSTKVDQPVLAPVEKWKNWTVHAVL